MTGGPLYQFMHGWGLAGSPQWGPIGTGWQGGGNVGGWPASPNPYWNGGGNWERDQLGGETGGGCPASPAPDQGVGEVMGREVVGRSWPVLGRGGNWGPGGGATKGWPASPSSNPKGASWGEGPTRLSWLAGCSAHLSDWLFWSSQCSGCFAFIYTD